ncbi:MAG TPA: hypothetical protein VE735_01165 [Gammaproteobacteria bacterium]|nr:hypothetical protein [Gammaproteobacteria bacterium]
MGIGADQSREIQDQGNPARLCLVHAIPWFRSGIGSLHGYGFLHHCTGRISTVVFSSLIIGVLLERGVLAVFVFMAGAMTGVALVVGLLAPRPTPWPWRRCLPEAGSWGSDQPRPPHASTVPALRRLLARRTDPTAFAGESHQKVMAKKSR